MTNLVFPSSHNFSYINKGVSYLDLVQVSLCTLGSLAMRTPHTHTFPASVILTCIPQVFVESLKLDIYQHELAIGKLFLIRRSAGEDNNKEATRLHALHPVLFGHIPTATCGARQTTTAKHKNRILQYLATPQN